MSASGANTKRTDFLHFKTVKGNPYLYFRHAKLAKPVRLPLDQTSAEFERCYDACLAEVRAASTTSVASVAPISAKAMHQEEPVATRHVGFIGGTFGQAVEYYKRSPEWLELRTSTRNQYSSQLDIMLENLGTVTLKSFDLDAVNVYSAEMAIQRWVKREVRGTMKKVRRGGPVAADTHVALLSNIWQVCRKYPEFKIKNVANPTLEADKRAPKSKHPALPWTEEQQDTFLRYAPEHLRLGYLMLKYFGQRGGDCIKITWAAWSGTGIWVAPEKGDDREPEHCEVPHILRDAICHARESRDVRDKTATILLTAWGTPWSSSNSLSAAIRNHLIDVGLAKRGVKTISMHGLRKTSAIMAAETDFGTAGIQAMTLHKSREMAEYYAARRERQKLRSKVVASINAMEEEKALTRKTKRAKLRAV